MANSMQPISPKRASYMSRRKCLHLPAASWKYRTSQPQQYITLGHSNTCRLQMFCTAKSLPTASTSSLREACQHGCPLHLHWFLSASILRFTPYSKVHLYISVPIQDLSAEVLQRMKHIIRSSTEYLKVRYQSELGYETSTQRTELTISTAR